MQVDSTRSNIATVANVGDTFEPILDAQQAATYLLMHPKTLQRMAREGHVPCIRLGRFVRFRLSTLDVWLRAKENRWSQPFCVK